MIHIRPLSALLNLDQRNVSSVKCKFAQNCAKMLRAMIYLGHTSPDVKLADRQCWEMGPGPLFSLSGPPKPSFFSSPPPHFSSSSSPVPPPGPSSSSSPPPPLLSSFPADFFSSLFPPPSLGGEVLTAGAGKAGLVQGSMAKLK